MATLCPTWEPREPHVDRVPLSTCGPRGPHVGHKVRGILVFCFPLSYFFQNFSFPPIHFKKQNSKSEFFLQFLVSCFDHNFFIRTQNWVIQKRKLLVSKRSTNCKQFQRHLKSAFFSVVRFSVRGQVLYVIFFFSFYLMFIYFNLPIWLIKYVKNDVRSYVRVVWLIDLSFSFVIWFEHILAKLEFSWNWF